jgi:hypothetical protein
MRDIAQAHPDLPIDFWLMETAECAFKGLFRRRRYIGYYIDRLHEEIVAIPNKDKAGVTKGVHWEVLEQFRTECLEPYYLRPGQPKGILEHALHAMVDRGELAQVHPKAVESENLDDYGLRIGVAEVRSEMSHKPISAQRKKDMLKLIKLNHLALEEPDYQSIYEAVKQRPLKGKI